MPPKTSDSAPTGNAVPATTRGLSPDHLSHPEKWATGADPATSSQMGFIGVLEAQKGLEVGEDRKADMGKSEASEIIDGLKHNKVIPPSEIDAPGAPPPAAVKRKRDSPGKKANGDVEEEAEDGEVTEEKDEDEVKGGKAGDSTAKADDKKDTEPNESASKTSDRSPVKKASSRSNSDSTSTSDEHPSAAKKARTSPTKASKSAPAPSASSKMDTDAPAAAEEDAPEDPSAASNAKAGKEVPNLPGDAAAPSEDHLSHPEEWATGDEPATEKQKGYLAVLEKKSGEGVAKTHENLGKSEASELIEELKDGQ